MDALLVAFAKSIYYIRSKGSSLCSRVLVQGAFVNEGEQVLTVCCSLLICSSFSSYSSSTKVKLTINF